jgi:chemotaxis protein MotB
MAKKKCPEFENHERWLVSYADMVTLLFAVFVVLYAIQISGQKEDRQVAGSMQESFNTPLEDIPMDRRIGPLEKGFGIFDHFKGENPEPKKLEKYQTEQHRIKIITDEMAKVKFDLDERLYGPEKFRKKVKDGFERVVSIERTDHGFKMQLTARHFFASGAAEILDSAKAELGEVAKILLDLGRPITIEGHTDSVPVRGQYSNWELSALRATSTLKFFLHKYNFPVTLMGAVGYADTRPIAHNGSESGRNLNRRIEIQVSYDEDTIIGGE